jgi:protein-tyrosine phosphatase
VNILFICSRNQWRSPTAEEIYRNHKNLNVKSAGTEASARIKITAKHINWADIIFVMEKKHKIRIVEKFPFEIKLKRIVILEIQDEYKFMDKELIEEIQAGVKQYIED